MIRVHIEDGGPAGVTLVLEDRELVDQWVTSHRAGAFDPGDGVKAVVSLLVDALDAVNAEAPEPEPEASKDDD